MSTITRNVTFYLCLMLVLDIFATAFEKMPRVQIGNGTIIIGKTYKTEGLQKPYHSFRGIPYAEPPIGDLRFRPPVPLPLSSLGTVYALKDASGCVQTGDLLVNVFGSEDCLYISVYTPHLQEETATLLPVMVWIYGGDFVEGNNSYIVFGPDYFLDEDVVFVSFNYRMGILGFLSTEDNVSPGNYGLKDQILALEWVQKNIAYFGGNPRRVTLFGQSSGSASVSYLMQTNLTKGLFQAAISESGVSLCSWTLIRNPKLTAIAVGAVLGIDITSSNSLVNGLRTVDYKRLQIAQVLVYGMELILGNPLNGLGFGPTTEPLHSGAVIVHSSYELLSEGFYHRIPYLLGFNSLELYELVAMVAKYFPWYFISYDFGVTRLVPISMNIHNLITKLLVNTIIKLYYYPRKITLTKQAAEYASDDAFTRPILEAARLISRSSDVYQYVFSYEGALGGITADSIGVSHSGELAYLFRQKYNIVKNPNYNDRLTRYRMVRMWTNFAKTGNPTPNIDQLLENVKWPLTTAAGKGNIAFLNISQNLIPGVNAKRESFAFWNFLFRTYGVPPYSTY